MLGVFCVFSGLLMAKKCPISVSIVFLLLVNKRDLFPVYVLIVEDEKSAEKIAEIRGKKGVNR